MRAIRLAMVACAVVKDWGVAAKLRTAAMMARKSRAVMLIDAKGGEEELGSTRAVGTRAEEWAASTCRVGTGSEVVVGDCGGCGS